jgi:ABC-type Fe3+ transport system permease subunit
MPAVRIGVEMSAMLRRLGRFGTVGAIALLGLPVALLLPAALLDRGPSGSVRASLFPLALVIFDSFVWNGVWNSLVAATLITALSLALGTALGSAVGPWRFWGRPPLALLAWVPLAIGPAFAAFGLQALFPPRPLGRGHVLFGVTLNDSLSWILLIWAGVASATPVVALSVKAALGRVSPVWSDTGRALGASRRRAWRQLVWPIVRPEVARTLAAVFATALLEPGAPLILGLRRTLPYQAVEAVTRNDPPTRLALLGLTGLIVALLGRAMIRWWGGARIAIDQHERTDRPARARWLRGIASIFGLAAWIAFGLAPLAGLVSIVVGGFDMADDAGWIIGIASLVYVMIDPDTSRLWSNALGLGLAVAAIDALLVFLVARTATPAQRRSQRPSLLILGFERTPALVFGIAAAVVPGLLELLADRSHLAAVRGLAGWLDPIRWPGVLLIAATAAARLPTLARASDRAERRARPALADAALSLGESRRRAIRLGGGRGPGLGALILTFTLAVTAITPAIVLTPTTRTRTVGPGVVLLSDDRPKAAGLALGAIALNLVGLFAARRGRSGPAGDWFRG